MVSQVYRGYIGISSGALGLALGGSICYVLRGYAGNMMELCWNHVGTMLETCCLLSACRYASVPACLCVSACQRAGIGFPGWQLFPAGKTDQLGETNHIGFPGRENYVGLMSA